MKITKVKRVGDIEEEINIQVDKDEELPIDGLYMLLKYLGFDIIEREYTEEQIIQAYKKRG